MRKEVIDADLREKVQQGLVIKYFVLNPTKKNRYGLASRMAIREYAKVINPINGKLARELNAWMDILP